MFKTIKEEALCSLQLDEFLIHKYKSLMLKMHKSKNFQ